MKYLLGMSVKFLAILLLALSFLTACSTSQTSSDASSKTSSTNSDSSKQPEITMFIDQTFWPLKDWTGKIPEEITKRTGIKVKVQIATDAQQLPLMISSGNMPDIVFTSSHFQQMSDSKISYSWDDLIKKYNIKDFNIDPMARVLNQGTDGKLYAVRNGFTNPTVYKNTPAAIGTAPAFSYRPDILKALGNPQINSLNDLENVLKQVKQKYPNMIPLVMEPIAIGQWFRVNFGVPYQGWDTVNGKATYYIHDPKQEEFYLFMNKLYREGLIKAENYTWTDANKAKELIENNQAFSILNVNAVNTINGEIKSTGKNFQIKQMTKLIGDSPAIFADSAGWSGSFITKNSKNPEAAIKFLQFMHSEEGQRLGLWGIEGQDYTLSKPIPQGGYPIFKYNSEDANVQAKMGVVWWGLLADTGIDEQVQRYVPGSDTTKALVNAKQYVQSNPMLGAVDPDQGTDEAAIKANIDNMIKNEQTKIYLAPSESAAKQAYESMMKTAESLGLSKLEDSANKKYQNLLAEYDKVKN